MPSPEQLTERELRVLEAVVQTYIETAEPAGSQTIARRFGLGVSSATIRNTMSELEEQGVPVPPPHLRRPDPDRPGLPVVRGQPDAARAAQPRASRSHAPHRAASARGTTIEEIVRRAAQVLGVLTQELGVAVAPALDEVVLERLDLMQVSADRLLLVFNLRSGVGPDHLRRGAGHGAADVTRCAR